MTDNAPQAITLTGAQLRGLLALSGLSPGEGSPLASLDIAGVLDGLTTEDWQTLRGMGWIDGGEPARLTGTAQSALEALCRPNAVASALLGTRETAMTAAMYAARGVDEDALVSFLADPDEDAYIIGPGQSPSTLVDAVAAQVFAEPLGEAILFNAALPPVAFVTMLGILEWRLHTQLQAMLDREPAPVPALTAQAIWEVLAEGRMANDLAWPVALFTYLLPFLDFELDEGAIQSALAGLETEGLVSRAEDGRYTVSSSLLDLADALLPVVSYAALHVDVQDQTGAVNGTHLAFLRGGAALLMVQPVVDENGERVMALDSLEAERFAEIIFELGLPGRLTGLGLPELRICPTCGAETRPGLAFCTQCGTEMSMATGEAEVAGSAVPDVTTAPSPRLCPNCGAEARAEWAFCNLCGTALPGSHGKGVR